MDDSIYKVQKVGGVHKTKRRYECSLFYPKDAGYNEYKYHFSFQQSHFLKKFILFIMSSIVTSFKYYF
jgi:hypothetical protein